MGQNGRHTVYTLEFKREVVAKMKSCANIPKLAKKLGLYKNMLYRWRIELDGFEGVDQSNPIKKPAPSRVFTLEVENAKLKKALAERVLEVDFFQSALRRVEAVPQSLSSGEPASTPKFGPGRSGKAN